MEIKDVTLDVTEEKKEETNVVSSHEYVIVWDPYMDHRDINAFRKLYKRDPPAPSVFYSGGLEKISLTEERLLRANAGFPSLGTHEYHEAKVYNGMIHAMEGQAALCKLSDIFNLVKGKWRVYQRQQAAIDYLLRETTGGSHEF